MYTYVLLENEINTSLTKIDYFEAKSQTLKNEKIF